MTFSLLIVTWRGLSNTVTVAKRDAGFLTFVTDVVRKGLGGWACYIVLEMTGLFSLSVAVKFND